MPTVDSYVDGLFNSNAVVCLDHLNEADKAVNTIKQDMFSDLLGTTQDILNDGGNHNTVKQVLGNFEKKYKKERGLKQMPGSYRSAKSVLVAAVKEGVDLANEGYPKGKSVLEKDIRQAKKNKGTSGSQEHTTVAAAVMEARNYIQNHAKGSVPDKENLGDQIELLERDLQDLKRSLVYGERT